MMKSIRNTAAAAFAVAALTACPGGALPGVAGLPSALPGATKGPDAALAAQCSANAPAAATSKGTDKHGKYKDQVLPNAWDNLADEKAVTEAIDKFKADAAGGAADKVNQWNCFNKFYGGALTVYYGIKG